MGALGFLQSVLNGTYNGMSQAGEDLAKGAMDAAVLPRDVYQGKVQTDPRYMSDEEFARTLNFAGNVAGGGITMGSAPEGALGMFAGRRSQTFPWDKAIAADIGETRGITPQKVYENTGMFRGVDRNLRYEIPDNKAAIQEAYMRHVQDGLADVAPSKLGDVLDHPELFKAYPQLADTAVVHDPSLRGTASYRHPWNGDTGQIRMNMTGAGYDNPMGTLLHEVQHGVQHIEGFAPGSNPRAPEIQNARPVLTAPAEQQYPVAWDAYHKAAGEVEARAVERRMHYTPAERQSLHPVAEESYFAPGEYRVPAEQQWVPKKQLPFPVDQYDQNLPFLAQYLGK